MPHNSYFLGMKYQYHPAMDYEFISRLIPFSILSRNDFRDEFHMDALNHNPIKLK